MTLMAMAQAAEACYGATIERHQRDIGEYGEDLEIRDWRWQA